MRIYQHKFDPTRQVMAVRLTDSNAAEVAEWCNGRDLEGSVPAVEVPVQGGASTVVVTEGDFVVVDENDEYFVRSENIFLAKYRLSDNQDEELVFDTGADEGQDDEHGHRYNESDWSENTSGDDDEEDRLQ